MSEKEAKAVSCPFCSAPYRKFIPENTVQLKCQYCGGVFLAPQIVSAVPKCPNHSDRLSVGICNDCGESFCGTCLHVYALETQNVSATLYLCPACLKARHIKQTDGYIYSGIAFTLLGILLAIGLMLFGILLVALGAAFIIYGVIRRSEPLEELTIDELRGEEEEKRAELEEAGGVDADELYQELLTGYMNRWGLASGTELLENEIAAYVRRGVSFPEAVKKVYQRQKTVSHGS